MRRISRRHVHVSLITALVLVSAMSGSADAQTPPVAPKAPPAPAPVRLTQPKAENIYLSIGRDGTMYVANTYGMSLARIDGALRSQLQLPSDTGVLVTNVNRGSRAQMAGLHANDILLSVGQQPIKNVDDLHRAIKAAKDQKIAVDLLRKGERKHLDLDFAARAFRVTIKSPQSRDEAFYIGVSMDSVNATLRSHLKLEEHIGVLVTDVVEDGPAAAAGIRKHDILIRVDDKLLTKPQDVQAAVAASKGKEISVHFMRAGRRQTLKVQPVKKPIVAPRYVPSWRLVPGGDNKVRIWNAPDGQVAGEFRYVYPAVASPPKTAETAKTDDKFEQRLAEIITKLDRLAVAIDRLNARDLNPKPANDGAARQQP